jgi:hypothetical protein
MRKSRKEQLDLEKAEKFYVRIARRERKYVVRERNPESEWDADDIGRDHEIEGFELAKKNESWDFVLTEKPTGEWYLVCAFYSSGDSFHREENCISLVSFVKNADDAEAILRAIEKDYKAYREHESWSHIPLKVHLPVANKDEEVYTGTWKGHFESLNCAEVRCLGRGMSIRF